MSLFENSDYKWRETYFVYFASYKMPRLEEAVGHMKNRIPGVQAVESSRDNRGRLQAVSLMFPDTPSAVEIILSEGEEVERQKSELEGMLDEKPSRKTRKALRNSNARFDILHFERTGGDRRIHDLFEDSNEEIPEDFDPACMLTLLDQLTGITRGVAIDPQSGMALT